ncbi:hypothetical protein HYT24_01780 [Candidatus Pacearchaeota archaeon]|nr:hypothetical protein [Candidatus Pacearchaeota archaeon]
MKTFVLFLTLLIVFSVFVSAQAEELGSPGITPDSPFYFLDVFFDTFQSPESVADEKAAEVVAMAESQNEVALTKSLEYYEKSITKLQERAQSDENIAEKVADQTTKHLTVLARVLESVPEKARPSIEKAVENSAKGREEAINALTRFNPSKGEQVSQQTSQSINENIPEATRENFVAKYPRFSNFVGSSGGGGGGGGGGSSGSQTTIYSVPNVGKNETTTTPNTTNPSGLSEQLYYIRIFLNYPGTVMGESDFHRFTVDKTQNSLSLKDLCFSYTPSVFTQFYESSLKSGEGVKIKCTVSSYYPNKEYPGLYYDGEFEYVWPSNAIYIHEYANYYYYKNGVRTSMGEIKIGGTNISSAKELCFKQASLNPNVIPVGSTNGTIRCYWNSTEIYFGSYPSTISNNQTNTSTTSINVTNKTSNNVTTNQTSICTDSDGGVNYDMQGTVSLTIVGSTSTYLEICNGINGVPIDGNYPATSVVEHSCANNALVTTYYDCLNGCSNGACIASGTNTTNLTTNSTITGQTILDRLWGLFKYR